jgi:SAM-dependent methyltransferase
MVRGVLRTRPIAYSGRDLTTVNDLEATVHDAPSQEPATSRGLLGDTPVRAYGDKLELFNRFAQPEIRKLIDTLNPAPGSHVLDAGCGVGLTTAWFGERVGPSGLVVGCDLSGPHLGIARINAGTGVGFVQADIATPPFQVGSFDLVWCANTINHLSEPVSGIRQLATTLRAGGRIALVQSGFLPDMFFAWDERLEREVMRAVRQYYRDKYGLNERDVTAMRGLIGLAQRAGLANIDIRSVIIERRAPLSATDRDYFQHAVFSGYWGERLRSYLQSDDYDEVQRLCDPASPAYCLVRPDFHHIQTLTMVTGHVSP